MPSLARFTRRFAVALTIATLASLSPAAVAAQRVTPSRFQPPPPRPLVRVESASGPAPQPAPQARPAHAHHFTCTQARLVGGSLGTVLGALDGLILGAGAMLVTGPYESGTARARAANRRTRNITIGGAVLGAAGGALAIDCGRL